MPARNSRKFYLENGYYHIYNRGVEKRKIFLDQQDYNVFLNYLKEYLSPKPTSELQSQLLDPQTTRAEKDKILKLLRMNNFAEEITLLAYCLMTNHFHFFVKQKHEGGIDKFMNSLGTRYSMYFNKKYTRVGSLYQGVYKAALVTNEEHYLHLSRYIHSQATVQGEALHKQPSSLPEYLHKRTTSWIHSEEILSYFSKTNPALSYEKFIQKPADLLLPSELAIEG